MPRDARLDAPGILQHVIVRGIEKTELFRDDQDRAGFLGRLSNLLLETDTDCLAWALLSNHFHLLLRPKRGNLPLLMRRLLTGHAIRFNRRHHRVGHLYQNRYKSIVCEEEPYLLELLRYIHLNPLRAGIAQSLRELDRYPWCGHTVLMGHRTFLGQKSEEILLRFGKRLAGACKKYCQFVEEGMPSGRRPELVDKAVKGPGGVERFDERILGDRSFIEWLRGQEDLKERLPKQVSLEELSNRVAEIYEIPEDLIRTGEKESQYGRSKSRILLPRS